MRRRESSVQVLILLVFLAVSPSLCASSQTEGGTLTESPRLGIIEHAIPEISDKLSNCSFGDDTFLQRLLSSTTIVDLENDTSPVLNDKTVAVVLSDLNGCASEIGVVMMDLLGRGYQRATCLEARKDDCSHLSHPDPFSAADDERVSLRNVYFYYKLENVAPYSGEVSTTGTSCIMRVILGRESDKTATITCSAELKSGSHQSWTERNDNCKSLTNACSEKIERLFGVDLLFDITDKSHPNRNIRMRFSEHSVYVMALSRVSFSYATVPKILRTVTLSAH